MSGTEQPRRLNRVMPDAKGARYPTNSATSEYMAGVAAGFSEGFAAGETQAWETVTVGAIGCHLTYSLAPASLSPGQLQRMADRLSRRLGRNYQ